LLKYAGQLDAHKPTNRRPQCFNIDVLREQVHVAKLGEKSVILVNVPGTLSSAQRPEDVKSGDV
jgi:hypothetical protein